MTDNSSGHFVQLQPTTRIPFFTSNKLLKNEFQFQKGRSDAYGFVENSTILRNY